MKTSTNIKRRVKHSFKYLAQNKHTKTHKNKHTKTHKNKHTKTHRGGASVAPQLNFNILSIDITYHNVNDFINAYANVNPISINNICREISFDCDDFDFTNIDDNDLINNSINIITNQFTVLTTLAIYACYLTVLPGSIGNLQTLKMLRLFDYYLLETLPESIGNLTALTTLDLSNCINLKTLPESIGSLTALTALNLKTCHALQKLPESIGNLTELTILILEDCISLKKLPETIGNLTNLKILSILKCAKLTHLPKTFWLLSKLQTFYYNQTPLTNPEILYLMPQITLSSVEASNYLDIIKTKVDYKVPINIMLKLVSLNTNTKTSHFEQHADNTTKQLTASLLLGITRLPEQSSFNPNVIEEMLEDNTYLRAIPYGLNPTKSIFDQIDIFTGLRT